MADVTTNGSSSDHKTDEVASQAPQEVDSQRDTAPTSEEDPIAQLEYTFPVTILIPSPTNQSTYLPSGPTDGESSSTKIVIHTASMEVLQDLRMQVQESPFGYWLGPFSFRLPIAEGANKGDVVNKGREALEVRLGEKLSDFIEVGEVFGGEGREQAEKVLEVVREPFSETDARTQVLRLKEYLATGSDAQDPAALGVSPGASMYEAVRDGLVPAVEDKKPSHEVALTNGQRSSAKGSSKKSSKPVPSQKSAPAVASASTKLVPSDKHLFNDFEGWVQTPLSTFHPRPAENLHAASCVKSYGVSPWNPPPPQYRAKGHLLYLSVTTLEGESVQLTCTVRGWFVSRSTSVVFDPTPRPSPKDFAAHSLIDLLHGLSPIFSSSFSKLVGKAQEPAADGPRPRELLAITPIQQALAANPWLVEPGVATTADPVRQQVSFLLSGATGPDGMEGAKDWNDEIQQAREMARETMQDRVNREKNLARIQAEFTAACVKGVMSISRGDVIPLNPHEVAPAHMWLHRNIFFTKGLDSIDSFSHLGADEAAHVACGKDVAGIRALNQIDVNGACLLGHTVVDWAGERWVCQSFLPGIFRRKDEETAAAAGEEAKIEDLDEGVAKKVADAVGESSELKPATAESSAPHLIVYGSDFEAGPEVVRWDSSFHTLMEKVADGFRLAVHDVKSGSDGSKVSLWTSSEVKGLHGTDGRKYILDAYRLSPVDVEFLQKDLEGPIYTKANVESLTRVAGADKDEADETTPNDADAAEETAGAAYPHRLLLLRPELLDSFWDSEFRKWATELASKRKVKDTPAADESAAEKKDETSEETPAGEDKEKVVPEEEQEQVVVQANGDIHVHKPSGEVTVTKAEGPSARFDLRFNPDAFVDTKPLPSGEKAKDLEQEKAHAFDVSLTTDESDPTVKAVRDASVFLRTIAIPSFLVDVITGRENCSDGLMLTQSLHKKGINMRYLGMVTANMERILTSGQSTDSSAHLNAFLVVSLQEMVFRAAKRILRSLIRGLLPDEWSAVVSHFLNCLVGVESDPKPVYEPSPFVLDSPSTWTSLTPTSLRAIITTEVQKRFRFNLPETYLTRDLKKPQIVRELALRVGFQLVARDYQFEALAAEAEGSAAKKGGKKARFGSATFEPVDVVAFVPTVKDAEPSSAASEETMEAGKITVNRGDKLAGLELMQESISLYETIHALFHKDVARAYNAYSVTVIQLYRAALGERSSEEPPKEGEVPEFYDQLQLAIRFQRQCVIVAERTLGLDHPDTLSYYQNLAMLEHLGDDLEMALKMFRHVLELWDVVYGVDHPDQLVLLTNIGQLLSLGSQFESSSSVFRSVCEVGSKIYGPNSVHIAQAQHALGQARFCVGDYAGAAEHSGIAARIFLDRLGKEDPLAIEAEGLHNAFVAQEKAAAKGTAGKRFVPSQRAALASRAANVEQQQLQQEEVIVTAPAAKKGAEAVKVDVNGVASRGHLEVEDLVNFISGDATKKASKPKSKKKAAK